MVKFAGLAGETRKMRRGSAGDDESARASGVTLVPFAGPAQAQVLGRAERTDAMSATLLNGISSHVLNFDATHLQTIVHASSAIVPPALALAEFRPGTTGAMSGEALTAKAADLMERVLPAAHAGELIAACWGVEKLPQAAVLVQRAAGT